MDNSDVALPQEVEKELERTLSSFILGAPESERETITFQPLQFDAECELDLSHDVIKTGDDKDAYVLEIEFNADLDEESGTGILTGLANLQGEINTVISSVLPEHADLFSFDLAEGDSFPEDNYSKSMQITTTISGEPMNINQ